MSVLLDTHAFLWWVTDSLELSERARGIIADEDTAIFVSAASAWEIATKVRLGKLSGTPGVVERFGELVAADGFRHLPVSYLHALRSGGYGVAHKDPFDRMLAAQSEIERLPLVTRDLAFSLFGIETIW
jgi:PIN domain nuclease of toxin-antitoxin system